MTMKTAAAYIRVSTDDQLEYSPDSQLKKIREYAEKNDMTLPGKFIFREEEGVSGKAAKKRPEFLRMIATARQKPKPFDVIIVWKFSRFARNRQDSIVYKSMLRKQCGIDVVSVTEQIGDDKMSILMEAMIEAMDEYYSINLAEEVRRGMNEKATRGKPVTAPAFGYRIRDKKYSADPETAPLVRTIFSDFIHGMGCRAIASELNAMGIRTRRGGLWENRTVEYILRNPVYIGKIRWNPKHKTGRNFNDPDIILTDGNHEPLLDDATWQKAQATLAKNQLMYGKSSGSKRPASTMLQGLVKCGSCGSTLSQSAGNSLQCTGYAHGKCGVSHSIPRNRLEEMVLAAIERNLRFSNIHLKKDPFPQTDDRARRIKNQILREQQKLARVKEAYESGIDSLEEYKAGKQKILGQIEKLKAEMPAPDFRPKPAEKQEICDRHQDSVKLLRDPLVGAEQKNIILRSFVEKIIFNREKNQIQIFYYL